LKQLVGGGAAIYARAASDEADQPSIEEQKAACRRWAEANGYEVAELYVELPGTEGPRDYPERERLIRAMRADPLDAVIVTSLDRFSRDPADLRSIREQATLGGVQLISLDEQGGG
jgi:site-specific DNA recombinase